jgi:hypothetical protein
MGKLSFSLRFVFLVLAGLTVAFGAVGYVYHLRMTQDIVTEAHWPPELTELIAHLRREGIEGDNVDVRSAGLITMWCWRMPAMDRAIAAHIDRFHLAPVANNGVEAQRLQKKFPLAWTWPKHENLECFAYPPGLPGAQEGEFESVLMHDRSGKQLYFYYYFNF